MDTTYGLTKQGIQDKDWFWQEVMLRANNNYGEWKGETQAMNRVQTAIYDICKDAKWTNDKNVEVLINNHGNEINKIVDDMLID